MAVSPVQAQNAKCVKQSPGHTVVLVELFSSEGCDSCPPADRWLGTLQESDQFPDKLIPLALHVDYWDYLGWKDPFADARFSERQRALSRLAGTSVVYTPEVFVNLRELRGWRSPAQFRQNLQRVNAEPARASIGLEIGAAVDGRLPLQARFRIKPDATPEKPQAYVALYENKLATAVKSGENKGATLRHDYVVRQWIGPIAFSGAAGELRAELKTTLAVERDINIKNFGIAAFVQDAGRRDVLQATALQVCS